jgi:hypothetical protein
MKVDVEKMISKLDKILMSENDINLLFEWRDNHKEYVRNFKPVLKEGCIVIEKDGNKTIEVFKSNGKFHTYHMFVNGRPVHQIVWDVETKKGITTFTDYNFSKEKEYQYNSSVLSLHASLMAYMEYYSDNAEYVERKEVSVTHHKKPKKNSKGKKSPTRIKRVIYDIKVTKESVKRDKNLYERHAEKWNVRGHWRHLKSGKKVWINPHVKGEGKEITPKEYKL